MAIDPRTFLITPCEAGKKKDAANTANKKGFFDAARSIGELEVLNDVGGGAIGEGLRTLVGVSDSIRTGESVVPGREGTQLFNTTLGRIANTAADNLEGGADVVLDATGVGRNTLDAVAAIDANTANRALGEAKSVFQSVKEGNYSLEDIPQAFSDFQNVEILGRSIWKGSPSANTRDLEVCEASPYAMDLIRFAPKFKFLFVMQIIFNPAYDAFKDLGHTVAFIVKNSTRPNIDFEYEEINQYNYWTRVPKRTVYQPMTMRFYDDNYNQATTFYNAYLRAMSPIANLPDDRFYEQDGMAFDKRNTAAAFPGPVPTHGYSASLGPLIDSNTKNIIKEIKLFHIYNYGERMNVYHFFKPKITNFELDELDMAESGNGSEMSFQFAYDGMHLVTNTQVKLEGTDNIVDLTGGAINALYPIRPVTAEIAEERYFSGADEGVPEASEQQNLLARIQESVSETFGQFTDSVKRGYEQVKNQTFASGSEALKSAGINNDNVKI